MSTVEDRGVEVRHGTVDLTAAINQTLDPMRFMQRVTDRTLELIAAADGVMVGVADDREVVYVCGAGHQVVNVGTAVHLDSSLSGLAVRTGSVQLSNDTGVDPRVDAEACRRLFVASLVCIPLRRGENCLGVLAVNAKRPNAFSDADVDLLRRLADFVSVVIGSALDLDRVGVDFINYAGPDDRAPADVDDAEDAANRYVMNILSPDVVERIDRGERVQAVLADPELLSIAFQPIVEVETGCVMAVEGLARFDGVPYRAPDIWFAEARGSGVGIELELLAVNCAIAAVPNLPAGVALAVNVGPDAVVSEEFRSAILRAPATSIVIELTEHEVIDDYAELVSVLQSLRRLGARVAVDDAGAGYSGLSHILKLAPDFIKLDRELVSGIDADPVRRALAASLVSFAADTGAKIIAEGVESKDELDVLRQLGLDYVQGYHLARPAPLADLFSTGRSRAPVCANPH
jgi:EAL domain-containing protein (putative c-di-GMP-specific phosphodiesterase class I)/putative methionine-R-sulfoxide reductase with GAF domain